MNAIYSHEDYHSDVDFRWRNNGTEWNRQFKFSSRLTPTTAAW